MKTRGSNLQYSGIENSARLERLFGLVSLTCLRLTVWLAGQQAVRVKGDSGRALNLIRHGAKTLMSVLRRDASRLTALTRFSPGTGCGLTEVSGAAGWKPRALQATVKLRQRLRS